MKKPLLTVDIIIQTPKGIILIERKDFPKGWAIPGGFVDYGETVEKAAIREAKEETSLDVKLIRQFHVYSDPHRDTRGHIISTVFVAKLKKAGQIPRAKDDAKEIGVFTRATLPKRIVFDHKQILKDYFSKRY